MERIAVPELTDAPVAATVEWRRLAAQLVPLWRHAIWAALLFAALMTGVAIRVEVQHLRQDLDRSARATREARLIQDRLRLELLTRRRAAVLEVAANQLALSDAIAVERIPR